MEPSEGFGLSAIGQIAVVAHDLSVMTAFYRDQLGMKFLFEFPGLAFFDCNGVRLMLSLPSSPEFDHPASIIYYRVADIQESFKILSGRGVKFEREPSITARMEKYDLWVAFLRDPENNLLALMAEVPK